ncbi:hypothetical protein R3I94_001561 [Phoxinus phoxinus]
MASSVHCDTDR